MIADCQGLLDGIVPAARAATGEGRVADYIPALACVPREKFGIAVAAIDGAEFAAGDADERFSAQSISKVFTLTLGLRAIGPALWERVGREPSGNAFNSLAQLDYENGIPRNPFINAGALVVTDALLGAMDPKAEILALLREITGVPDIGFDAAVARSEAETGFRNRALAWYLRSFGNLREDVDAVLDVYFHHCAVAMSCRELARAFLHLANGGVSPLTGRAVVNPRQARRINALMMTCGLYDAVGNFAFRVGLPAKSGVGGGIVAVMPGECAVCVWSPALDAAGNSHAGTLALEMFAGGAGRSVF